MNSLFNEITKAAHSLPAVDRARLADDLVQSIADEDASEIDKLWFDEAKRRRDEVRNGEVETVPGTEALLSVRELIS